MIIYKSRYNSDNIQVKIGHPAWLNNPQITTQLQSLPQGGYVWFGESEGEVGRSEDIIYLLQRPVKVISLDDLVCQHT